VSIGHEGEVLHQNGAECCWQLVQIADDAVVAEGEVFQVRHQSDAFLSFLLHRTLQRKDASLFLIFLCRVQDHEDVQVPLFCCFLHASLHVSFVEPPVWDYYCKRTRDASSDLRLSVLEIKQFVIVAHEIGHRVIMAFFGRMSELELAHDERCALVGIVVFEWLEQLEPVSDPCDCYLANLKSVERFDESDQRLKREESKVLLPHAQGIVNGNQYFVVSFAWQGSS